jgi:hypothetical protein
LWRLKKADIRAVGIKQLQQPHGLEKFKAIRLREQAVFHAPAD